MMTSYSELARDVHEQNIRAGWWDGFDDKRDRHETAMMLVVTELAEAAEGVRKDLQDDHLPHHKMFDVELADAAIRLLDLAGAYELGSELNDFVEFMLIDEQFRHALEIAPNDLARLFCIVSLIGAVSECDQQVATGLGTTFALAKYKNIDLLPIIAEKREYNRNRADHKRENREKPGGKRW